MDAFLKTTQEVLGPLNLTTAHDRLTRFEFLDTDRKAAAGNLRREVRMPRLSWSTTVPPRSRVESRLGGSVMLPPWGFVVEGPKFAAFFARRWNGRDYPEGALFTLRARGRRDTCPCRPRPDLPRLRRSSDRLARLDA